MNDETSGGRARFCGTSVGAVLALILVVAVLFPRSVQAMAAFASGVPDDVAAKGVALGEAHNYDSRETAEARALTECQTNKDSTDDVHALCKIVDHFDNRCLSTALDPKAGTPGWGWSIANNGNDADDQALTMCRQSAGADRAPYCVITASVCDGTAAGPK
ncbi:MAG: DUF4189 domain-containing protein [Rhizomicrobium sp.]